MAEPTIPRRARMDRWSPAEHSIAEAVEEVEKMAADERLTKAVILLGDAKAWVADYLDDVKPEDHYPRPAPDLLRDAAPQLLESLLAVEWAGFTEDDRGDFVDACPNCLSPIGDPEIEGSGLHTPTCELRDALDAALGVKSPRAEVVHG